MTGTSGTTDVMNVRIINAGTAASTLTFAGLQTSGVERLNFSLTDGTDGINTTSIATGSFTGATTLAVAGSSNVNTTSTVRDIIAFTGVAATVALELGANTSQTNVSVTTVGTSTSGDSFTLNTVGGSNGVVTLTDAAADGFVTVNIASSGTVVSTIKTLDTKSSNTTVNVTGTGALTITDALGTSVKTLDASAATGVIKAGVVASSTLSAKGGTGTSDVLAITAIDSTVYTSGLAITGFETVSLLTTAGGTGTIALSQITGATAINIAANTAATGSLTMTKAASGQGINYVGGASSTASYLFNAVTQTLAATGGTTDAITIAVNNAGTTSTGTAKTGNLVLTEYESATITVQGFATTTLGTLSLATVATALTINATTNLVLGAIVGATALTTINASGSAGNVTVNVGSSIAALTYTGSLGVDTVTNGAITNGVLQTYNLGTGDDVFTVVATATSGQIQLNGDAGNDIFKFTDAIANELIGVDGGLGVDSVTATGSTTTAAYIFDAWAGLEKFQDNTAEAVTFTVATGYADAMEFTTINNSGITTFTTAATAATVNLSNLTFTGAAFGAVTQLVLSTTGNGATFLTGASQATTINGGSGIDTIVGGAGVDSITGGAGADIMTGGGLADVFIIGATTAATGVATAGTASTSTTTLDIITVDVAANVKINFAATLVTEGNYDAFTTISNGGNIALTVAEGATPNNGTVSLIMGTYNATANTFTSSSTGVNAAMLSAAGTNAGTTATDSIIIVGVTAAGDFAIADGIVTI